MSDSSSYLAMTALVQDSCFTLELVASYFPGKLFTLKSNIFNSMEYMDSKQASSAVLLLKGQGFGIFTAFNDRIGKPMTGVWYNNMVEKEMMKHSCIRTEVLISEVIHLRAGKEKTWQYT